jgi:hypothetical protein
MHNYGFVTILKFGILKQPTLSKKKRNRKNKKKQENENVEPEESFDEIIAKYGFSNGPEAKKANNNKKTKSHLDIEPKFLDPDAELKRIFGSAAVNSDRSNRRKGSLILSQYN